MRAICKRADVYAGAICAYCMYVILRINAYRGVPLRQKGELGCSLSIFLFFYFFLGDDIGDK